MTAKGREFDEGNSTDLTILQPVMDRFGLKSLQQTRVLWEYMKYVGGEFATFGYNTTPGAKAL